MVLVLWSVTSVDSDMESSKIAAPALAALPRQVLLSLILLVTGLLLFPGSMFLR